MANIVQSIPKIIRNLKDHSKPSLQCAALTYIRSNAEALETTLALKEEEYSEICKLVIDTIASADQNTRNEATKALHVILKHFKSHSLKFFESALQVNKKKRLKIFHFLESADDGMLWNAAKDPMTLNFFNDCVHTVQTNTMEWLLPSACTDNLRMLTQAESQSLTDEQELEEITIICALTLLQRFYKIASGSGDYQCIQKFDTLLMDKVVILAYMGHKRQRDPAIKLLNQAIDTNLGMHIKTKYTDIWTKYKNDLQGPYCTRMALLVKACESDWSSQWSISIRLLGTDLHRGATLINNLLSVEERAFKSTDTNVRRQAFVSWKLLVDNFALDLKELATARRIKLLCVPLTSKNSKTELIALTKLEVWWYLITKLYPNLTKFTDPVVTQFLNFCFGPLGDTPLLSAKVDVTASPGKRFYKTKVVSIDALLQLIVRNQEDRKGLAPVLEQRLTNSITDDLFKQCYKPLLHSIGEAIVIISQLHESEMRNREEIIKVVLANIMRYVQSTNAEVKSDVYNEFMLVVTALEMENRALEMSCVNDFVRDIFLPELSKVAADLTFRDTIFMDLMTKIMTKSFLKNVQKKHCDSIKCLLWQLVKPKGQNHFHPETLKLLGNMMNELESIPTDETGFANCFELWYAYAEIAYKFALSQDINEGTSTEPSFKTIEEIVRFPFAHMYSTNTIQAQSIAVHWKDLYKQFESKADVISGVKSNEIFNKTSQMIEDCLAKNEKTYRIAVYCLDALLSTINYEDLLAQNKIPTIVRLVANVTTIALHEGQPTEADCALKALSALLITVFGHSPEKALVYLKETSQTIELMLKTDAGDILVKEVTSTWETIVSILRGLSNLLDGNFLASYREIILSATRHVNPEIVSQAEAVIAMKENVKDAAKAVLVELEQEVKKSSLKIKSDKADRAIKQVRLAGSFMNRKIPSPRPSLGKQKEREEKKLTPLPPEPDSQDYVVIKSNVKLDVNRLTEHQIESFKRRRDDIPAMYNDLSQSSSQNTQDLLKWFEGKGKKTGEPDAAPVEKVTAAVITDDNHNKENKIDKISASKEDKIIEASIAPTNVVVSNKPEEKSSSDNSTPSSLGPSGQEFPSDFANIIEPNKEFEKPPEKKELQRAVVNLSPVHSPLADHSYVGNLSARGSASSNKDDIIPKKLNFESRTEYPDDEDKEMDESPCSSDAASSNSKANRALRSTKGNPSSEGNIGQNVKKSRLQNRGKIAAANRESKNLNSESQDQNSGAIQKRGAAKPLRGNATKKSQNEKGVKRKAVSDSESDGSERSKRLRRKSSRSPSGTPSDNEGVPSAPLDKRTESEMTRLRIDMVFDGPLPSRRRSKANDELGTNDAQGKRSHSPDSSKPTRAKSAEIRSTDKNIRRSSRGPEKEGTGSADVAKKRRRTTKALATRNNNSVSQTIVDDEETPEEKAVIDNTEIDKSVENAVNIVVNETNSESNISTNVVVSVEQPTVNDDDIVESSQEDPSVAGSNRKSIISALKFGKTNTADEIETPVDPEESVIGEPLPRASSPINAGDVLMESEDLEKDVTAAGEKTHDDSDETFLDISAIRPQAADEVVPEDVEKKALEENKSNGTVSSSKPEPSFNFSSPKTSSKRFMKPKSFAVHGRAAHMLGLVTKLAVLEKDCEVEKFHSEEESIFSKKLKAKENETEPPAKKERLMLKDSERMGSPGGSRQEKIFNNMKSADYAASPPGKLFGNLKNNGEKVSPNMSKNHAESTLESDFSARDEEDTDVSQPSDRDELPILEWSSANPPSLTASPSASILKRIRQLTADTEMETTSNRSMRKRVSFADPPVSKEMGYEIAPGGSPHRTGKFTTRSLFDRKNTPLRLKQSRFKMIQIDPEKTDKDDEPPQALSSSEMDMDCERENALLVKIADDLEEAAEFRAAEISPEKNVPTIVMMDSCQEIEIGDSEKPEKEPTKITSQDDGVALASKNTSKEKNATVDDVETQDDLFNSSDEKNESPKHCTNRSVDISKNEFSNSTQNSTIESFKLNVTNDSVIGSLNSLPCDDNNKSEYLEDTVDVRNITGLNCTGNSEEMFCEKPARSSTQAPDDLSQMDTLPVTDSIFASLPITQDSQDSTQAHMELAQPELLNSTDAIYPSLVNCDKSIETIVDSLTHPLWVKNLSKNLTTRGINTVGDMARLSEREIARIPVKGSPKVEFVRKVLRRFEENLSASSVKLPAIKNDDKSVDYLALTAEKDSSMIIAGEHMNVSELPTLDVSAVSLPSQDAENNSVAMEDLNPHLPQSIRRTSTTIASVTTDPSIYTVLEDTPTSSQMSTINLSSDTLSGMMISVGTSTETLVQKQTKSVGSQMKLEDLLDEIDVKLVLDSAVRRSSAETLLAQYKLKMGHMSESELGKETMRMLAVDSKATYSEASLKKVCRECGVNKVLSRLPDIFSTDKQFYVKVLNTYRKKMKISDVLEALNFEDIKDEICKKCSSSDLVEMLTKTLKEEENKDVKSRPEHAGFSAMLKKIPLDVIISHTVANKELVPSSVVLNIALQNNEAHIVTNEIESQHPEIAQKLVDRKMTPEFIKSHIKNTPMTKDTLLSVHKEICAKLSPEELLDAYHEAMKEKLNENFG